MNKKKKIKWICTVVVLILIGIYVISSTKIKSAKQYEKDRNESEIVAVEDDKKVNDSTKTSKDTDNSSNTNEEKSDSSKKDENDSDKNNTKDSVATSTTTSQDNTQSVNNDSMTNATSSSDNKNNVANTNSSTSSNTADVPQKKIRTSIEIRCDRAVELKDNIHNEDVKNSLPADGTMLATMSYEVPEGTTVYDLLREATANNGMSISADKGYVRLINNLGEKSTSAGSGWKYKVNNVCPSVGSNSYVLKENDTVVWYYVNDYRE